MELIGSLFLILALLILVALFVARPFFQRTGLQVSMNAVVEEQEREHKRSALLADRDRILLALQELEFDYALGKVPEEDYPMQRSALLRRGASILRQLDEIQPDLQSSGTAEDRIEAAVAARRADAAQQASLQGAPVSTTARVGVTKANGGKGSAGKDDLEDLIASRRRQRQEKSAGFCPSCGKPVQKSDKFCSRCGTTL